MKGTPSDRDKLIPLDTHSAVSTQELHTNPTKRSLLYAFTAIALIIIVIAIGVIIYVLDLQSSSSDTTSDINWFHDVILSETIDASGLPHGILHKLLNLTQPLQEIYRSGYDINWSYTGDPDDNIFSQNSLTVQTRYIS